MQRLKEQMFGDSVAVLQKKLREQNPNLAVDGWFGAKTFDAVMKHQTQSGLARDGVAGFKTLRSLGLIKTGVPTLLIVTKSRRGSIYEGADANQVSDAQLKGKQGKCVYDQFVLDDKVTSFRDYKECDDYNLDENDAIAINVCIVTDTSGEASEKQKGLIISLIEKIKRDFKNIKVAGFEMPKAKPKPKKATAKGTSKPDVKEGS